MSPKIRSWFIGCEEHFYLSARILRNLLARLDIRCDNEEHGCTAVVKLDTLARHIKECDFNPKVSSAAHYRVCTRVSDPHWFNADPDTDPDPAFFLIADPDSGSGSRIRIPDPDPGSGSRVWWPKTEKKLQLKKKLIFFWIKNYNLPIPRPP